MPLFVTKYIQISDICQVRLDFFKVVLQQPTSTTGSCTNTYTTITPGATGVTAYNRPPSLCGTLTDQHCTSITLLSFEPQTFSMHIDIIYRHHIFTQIVLIYLFIRTHFLYFQCTLTLAELLQLLQPSSSHLLVPVIIIGGYVTLQAMRSYLFNIA